MCIDSWALLISKNRNGLLENHKKVETQSGHMSFTENEGYYFKKISPVHNSKSTLVTGLVICIPNLGSFLASNKSSKIENLEK